MRVHLAAYIYSKNVGNMIDDYAECVEAKKNQYEN